MGKLNQKRKELRLRYVRCQHQVDEIDKSCEHRFCDLDVTTALEKESQASFIFFIPKQSRIKDPKKIKDQKAKIFKDKNVTAANAQLLDKNKLIAKINFLNQVLNSNRDFFNAESVANSIAISKTNFNIADVDEANLIFGLWTTEANKTQLREKKV